MDIHSAAMDTNSAAMDLNSAALDLNSAAKDYISSLPLELLCRIASYLKDDIRALHSCILSARKISAAAQQQLYKHIDLNFDEREFRVDNPKTRERQAQLMLSLAQNQSLGALVQIFIMPSECNWNLNAGILVQAAGNMLKLAKATLSASPITTHIIHHVQCYTALVDLEIYGVMPEEHLWVPQPTSLVSLKWEYPTVRQGQACVNTALLLLNVASTTCPHLRSLSMTSHEVDYRHVHNDVTARLNDPQYPAVLSALGLTQCEAYRTTPRQRGSQLHDLGFHHTEVWNDETDIVPDLGLAISMFPSSLTSASIPINCEIYTSRALSRLLGLGKANPGLKALALTHVLFEPGMYHGQDPDDKLSPESFYQSLITGFNSFGISIEKFCTANLGSGTRYSTEMGELFAQWKHLKWLQVADDQVTNQEVHHANNDNCDFENYSPLILNFLMALPASLQEIYLEINFGYNPLETSEQFDPISEIGPQAFTWLTKLHTLDILAWTELMYQAYGPTHLPEKGIFWRRLPLLNPNQTAAEDAKALFCSRLDNAGDTYGDRRTKLNVKVKEEMVQAASGKTFTGADAKEAWLSGWETVGESPEYVGASEELKVWPFCVSEIWKYHMFLKEKDYP